MKKVHQIDRQEVHRIHQQHPQEHSKCRRSNEAMRIAVIDALDLIVDEVDQPLDEHLALPRDTGGGPADDPAQEAQRDHSEQHRHGNRVPMHRPEPFARRIERQVIGNIGSRCQLIFGSHSARFL